MLAFIFQAAGVLHGVLHTCTPIALALCIVLNSELLTVLMIVEVLSEGLPSSAILLRSSDRPAPLVGDQSNCACEDVTLGVIQALDAPKPAMVCFCVVQLIVAAESSCRGSSCSNAAQRERFSGLRTERPRRRANPRRQTTDRFADSSALF